jgi:hypothetical protein
MPTMILIASLVFVVMAIAALITNKTRLFCSVLGYSLIALQLLVLFRNSNMGKEVKFFTNVTNPSLFLWELFGFIGYNLFLIIGIVCLIVANREKKKTIVANEETTEEDEDEEDENKE